jgi:ferritin-like protein
MGQNSTTLHEAAETLSADVVDRHRAIASLMEELEAVDWYDQRVQACTDEELKQILAHNRDEEKEHACMVLEWLRRRDPVFDKHMKRFLFTDGPIHEIEDVAESSNGGKAPSAGSLGIGGLRARTEEIT